jgi:hypothetical protein
MTEADLAALPRFNWLEPPASRVFRELLLRVLGVLAAGGLAALGAWRALRRYPVV